MPDTRQIDEAYEAVGASYHRCEETGDWFDTFYEIFFSKSPEIPPKFANTDMQKQKQVVVASVLMMLRLGTDDLAARRAVEEIAATHSRRGHDIRPELYPLWLDALCEAVGRHDSQYTPELEASWRRLMQKGIDLIVSRY